jgi:hypothetical protein
MLTLCRPRKGRVGENTGFRQSFAERPDFGSEN